LASSFSYVINHDLTSTPNRNQETIIISLWETDPNQWVKSQTLNNQFLQSMQWFMEVKLLKSNNLKGLYNVLDMSYDDEEETQEDWHPMALGTIANAKFNPTWEQAMNGPDAVG
jgi:hypothetical protein